MCVLEFQSLITEMLNLSTLLAVMPFKINSIFYVCFFKCNAHIYPLIITNYFKCYSEILLILASRENYCFIFKLTFVFTSVNSFNKYHSP